jgi:hypothetical protein
MGQENTNAVRKCSHLYTRHADNVFVLQGKLDFVAMQTGIAELGAKDLSFLRMHGIIQYRIHVYEHQHHISRLK